MPVNWTNARTTWVLAEAIKKLKHSPDASNKLDTELSDKLYDLVMADYINDINRLPIEFFGRTKQLEVKLSSSGGVLIADLSSHRVWPSDTSVFAAANLTIPNRYSYNNRFVLNTANPRFESVIGELEKKERILGTTLDELSNYQKHLRMLISANRRIAATVKVWPPIKTFLDAGTLAALEQEPVTKLRSISDGGADLDFLSLMAVRSRVL